MSVRRDHVVILARGASSRMGRPKGLCTPAGRDRTLLEGVADLYRRFGLPVAVVTTPELADLYRRESAGLEAVRWIEHPTGGGTAATCLAAVRALAGSATHLWLHPVDLPDVLPETLTRLRAASEAEPDALLIPRCRGRRGHPVLTPLEIWLDSVHDDPPGEMRELIAAIGCDTRWLDVDDPGVWRDVDRPEDLDREPDGTPRR